MNGRESYFQRRFIIDGLPEGIAPADEHIQIFENYVRDTDLRLRSLRRPSSDERKRFLERLTNIGKFGILLESFEMTREEYEALRPLRGREIRKNRYELERDGRRYDVDVYLGPLWGLNIASTSFETEEAAEAFEQPDISVLDISEDRSFYGRELCDSDLKEVRKAFRKAKGEG